MKEIFFIALTFSPTRNVTEQSYRKANNLSSLTCNKKKNPMFIKWHNNRVVYLSYSFNVFALKEYSMKRVLSCENDKTSCPKIINVNYQIVRDFPCKISKLRNVAKVEINLYHEYKCDINFNRLNLHWIPSKDGNDARIE